MAKTIADEDVTEKPSAPSLWKRATDKLELSVPMLLLMFKGAVGPTIGVAIYQNGKVAAHYSTIGYLIPIMTILTVPIMPRARFIQNFIVSSILVCLAAAISLLAMWCSVKARENTTHKSESKSNGPVPGALISPYNATAATNMGVWFFFMVWLANMFRAYRPQYFLPSILFGVFINVTGAYGPLFGMMEACEVLVSRLLETFFAGFAISLAVNFFVIPFTSRNLISMFATQEIYAFKSVLQAHNKYLISLTSRDWYGSSRSSASSNIADNDDPLTQNSHWPEADALKVATTKAAEFQIKMKSEIRYAKREADWSKLSAKDYSSIVRLCKDILLPVLALDSMTEITTRLEQRGGWSTIREPLDHSLSDDDFNALEEKEKREWLQVFENLHVSVQELQVLMSQGLDHVLYQLELVKRPKSTTTTDLEANVADLAPGSLRFAKLLEAGIQAFLKEREGPLKEWCAEKGMDHSTVRDGMRPTDYPLHQRHQSQLYLILDLEHSLLITARAILSLVQFADSKVNDGTMAQNRFIFPDWKRLRKWVIASLSREDSNLDYQSYSTRSGTVTVRLHETINSRIDAEHLPPTTKWQKSTHNLRTIGHFIGGKESLFGLRVAIATMCIMLIAYIRSSQQFFIEQRLLWGSIMVAISMSQTAGSGLYGQFLRFFGTALAMIFSYIDWYLPDQHTAGIIVFLGLTMFLYHYPMIRWQSDPVVPMIGMVTVVLIVGYELQVKQIGVRASVANGQVYYPLYELAPFRLAAVLGGVGVAFFFTYFPSTITAKTQLRTDLGASLHVLGRYVGCVQRGAQLRIRGEESDEREEKRSMKLRGKLFTKELILLQGMRHHRVFTRWEPSFGGRFPRERYDKLIFHVQNILLFTTQISNVTSTLSSLNPPTTSISTSTPTSTSPSSSNKPWLRTLTSLLRTLDSTSTTTTTSPQITTLLSIIASSISAGTPLPPGLEAPEPISLGKVLIGLDPDVLSAEFVGEEGYRGFAVVQVARMMISEHLKGLLEEAKALLGEGGYGGGGGHIVEYMPATVGNANAASGSSDGIEVEVDSEDVIEEVKEAGKA